MTTGSTRNLTLTITDHAGKEPDSPALLLPGNVISYSQLDTLIWLSAQDLYNRGVRPGHTVALTLRQQPKELIMTMSVALLGASSLSVPCSWADSRRNETVRGIDPDFVVTDLRDQQDAGAITLLVDSQVSHEPVDHIDRSILDETPDAFMMLATSSGSTGVPKWFGLSHRNIADRISRRMEAFSITRSDIFARVPSIPFLGSKFRYLTHLSAGARVLFCDYGKIGLTEACNRYGVTFLSCVSIHVENALKKSTQESSLPGLRVLELSAARIDQSLRQRVMKHLTPNLYITYSSNEFGASNVATPADIERFPGTVGKPLPGIELQIVDEDDCEVPAGTIGNIRMRAEHMIKHYLVPEGADALRNGWFFPGDLGRKADSDQLVHHGRADDLMILDGINIHPAEIVQCLKAHTEVDDVFVFPLKHPVRQDIPVALVSLTHGSAVAERTLLEFSRSRLGSSAPGRIFVVKRIPRNEMGKLDKRRVDRIIQIALAGCEVQLSRHAFVMKDGEGRKQLYRSVNIRTRFGSVTDVELMKKWLKVFIADDDHDEFTESAMNLSVSDGNRGRVWFAICLAFTRYLLQSSRVPFFAPPRMVTLPNEAYESEELTAVAAFPHVDGIPDSLYSNTLRSVVEILHWAGTHEVSPSNRDYLFRQIESRVIKRVRGTCNFGKSTYPVLKQAYILDIPFRYIAGGICQLGWGSRLRLLDRSATEADSIMGVRLSTDKACTAQLLREAGLPCPRHFLVPNERAAAESARKLEWPVVVKPLSLERGEGITIDVASEESVINAYKKAADASNSSQVLVEEQVKGTCHRIFVANGEMLYAVKRLPISIEADGVHSIESIVRRHIESQSVVPPWAREKTVPVDDLSVAAIRSAGFSLDSVPEKGIRIPLRRIESTAWGGVDEDVTDTIHPDNVAIALRATAVFGLNVAGIDIMSEDITVPWHKNGAIINEVNFSPLLGGGDISRQYITRYLEGYMEGNGRIPVDVYVGGKQAMVEAAHVLESGCEQHTVITDGRSVLSSDSKDVHLTASSLSQTIKSLLLWRDTEVLIIVVHTDELLKTGLPVASVDNVHFIDQKLVSAYTGKPVSPDRYRQLVSLLEKW